MSSRERGIRADQGSKPPTGEAFKTRAALAHSPEVWDSVTVAGVLGTGVFLRLPG